jgi:hypothetical protein
LLRVGPKVASIAQRYQSFGVRASTDILRSPYHADSIRYLRLCRRAGERISFFDMAPDLIGFDLLTLKGDPLERAMSALRIARQQVQLAYADTGSVRLEEVLSDIEDAISDHVTSIRDAVEDDDDDYRASEEWMKARQAKLPLGAS